LGAHLAVKYITLYTYEFQINDEQMTGQKYICHGIHSQMAVS